MITSASFNYNHIEVSASSCGVRGWDPQQSSSGPNESSVSFPVSFCSLLFAWSAFLGNCSRVTVHGVGKRSLKCFCWHGRACQQEFGRTRRVCTIQAQLVNPQTRGSAVHLTCRRRRTRRSFTFNYLFFSLFDIQPSLSLPAGSRKVTAKPFFWLGFCNTRFWPPEELLSLWHMLRRSIISLFLILSHTLSVLSDLSSQGLVKLPGRNKSKRWTGPVSPVSHKLLQTFLFH